VIDDIDIQERPEPMPVSRGEVNGVWTSLDQVRIAQQSASDDIADIKQALGSISTEQQWQRRIMLVPCAIATAVLMLIVVRQLDAILTAPPLVLSMLGLAP